MSSPFFHFLQSGRNKIGFSPLVCFFLSRLQQFTVAGRSHSSKSTLLLHTTSCTKIQSTLTLPIHTIDILLAFFIVGSDLKRFNFRFLLVMSLKDWDCEIVFVSIVRLFIFSFVEKHLPVFHFCEPDFIETEELAGLEYAVAQTVFKRRSHFLLFRMAHFKFLYFSQQISLFDFTIEQLFLILFHNFLQFFILAFYFLENLIFVKHLLVHF